MEKWKSESPCIICGNPAEIHHLYSRGSHPALANKTWNHMPLCRIHHSAAHAYGLLQFSERNELVEKYLKSKGWEMDYYMSRWWHAK